MAAREGPLLGADATLPDAGANTQALNLAVVLTGGVSLAVWMGGVVTELQRLATGAGAFGRLTELTRTRVSIDVIGGSSAGGINGAILATALACGRDASAVRSVWIERASLRALLRDRVEDSRTSLLRGDGYFLPHLRAVFDELCGPPVSASEQPVELILTGTLLDGLAVTHRDSFGSTFTDTTHRAEFRFRRGPDRGADDFADPRLAAQLALAARATSSFPGAFEPTFCPVGTGADGDLAGHVNFSAGGYVIDGGVLVNKPLGPVLEEVIRRRDEAGTRRVVVFVQPAPDQQRAEVPGDAPGFGHVVQAGLLTLPHAESLARELSEVRAYNARVIRNNRALRAELDLPPDDLVTAAAHLVDDYHQLAGSHTQPTLPADTAGFAEWPWTVEQVRHALTVLEIMAASGAHLCASELDRLTGELRCAEARPAPAPAVWCDAMHAEIAGLIARARADSFGTGAEAVMSCRRWLLAGAIVRGVSASGRLTGSVPVDLLHVSAEAPCALDGRDRPEQKLAGLQLQHFGAFYRSAWRANDWMWGRLDAISRIVQMLLDPARLAELAAHDPTFPERCRRTIESLAADVTCLPERWQQQVAHELDSLRPDAGRCPERLPMCVQVVTASLQLAAAAEELPRIAERIIADGRDGHRVPDTSRALLTRIEQARDGTGIRAALAECRVGEERLRDDVGSPAYEHVLDRLTVWFLGAGALGTGRRAALVRRSPSTAPLWRAVQHAAALRRWPVLLMAAALSAGAALTLAATSDTAARVTAVIVGALLITVGTAVAGLLARRLRRWAAAATGSLVGCVMLAFAGPWYWRGWLIAACAVDITLSVRRACKLRTETAPASLGEVPP